MVKFMRIRDNSNVKSPVNFSLNEGFGHRNISNTMANSPSGSPKVQAFSKSDPIIK